MNEAEIPKIIPQTRRTLEMTIKAIKDRESTFEVALAAFVIEKTEDVSFDSL